MNALRSATRITVTLTFGALAACTLASPTYITAEEGLAGDGGTSKASVDPATGSASEGPTPPSGGECATNDYIKPDLSKLTACANGKGHCYARAKAPTEFAAIYVACPGSQSDVCVPDNVLTANGAKLKSCKSIIGEGGCVNIDVFPEIAKQGGSALTPDVCDPDQKCVPCTDPSTQKPSGFCVVTGVHEKECTAGGGAAGGDGAAGGSSGGGGATPQATCCAKNGKSNGVCLPDGPATSKAPQNTCPSGSKCAPAAFVSGNPVKCDSGILGAGLCLDKCFDTMLSIAGTLGFLSSDGCGNTEVCAPCSALKSQGPVPGCG
jgi:hypothetical protein